MINLNINSINELSLKLVLILCNLSFKSILILLFVILFNRIYKDAHGKIKQVFIFLSIISIFCLPFFYNLGIKILNFFYAKSPQTIIFNPVFRTLRIFDYGLINTTFSKLNENLFSKSIYKQNLQLSWTFYLFITWLIGFIFFLGIFFVKKILILQIIKKSKLVTNKLLLNKIETIYQKLDLKNRISIYFSENCHVPLTYWFFTNYILLPDNFLKWSFSRREMSLMHELIHIKKHDCIQKNVIGLLSTFFWFNPLIWYVYKIFCIEQEKTCDSYLINEGYNRFEYANELISIAKSNRSGSICFKNSISISNTSSLEKRIQNIINFSKVKKNQNKIFLMILMAFLLLLPILAINPLVTTTQNEITDKLKILKNKDDLTNISEISPQMLPLIYKIPLIWPIANGYGINEEKSVFATKYRSWAGKYIQYKLDKKIIDQKDPTQELRKNGIFITIPKKMPIVATADGVVESFCFEGALKSYIVIRHANGIRTYYSCLDNYNRKIVVKNKNIKQGQVIAYPIYQTMLYNNKIYQQYIFHYMIKLPEDKNNSINYFNGLNSRIYYPY